jgi:hypothetical protein
LRVQRLFTKFKAACLTVVLASTALFVASVPRARADDHEKCEKRIAKAEARLDQAIRHHGKQSSQAESRRHELSQERQRCWDTHHGWRDGAAHKWHSDRDWDRDEQARDHKHDDHPDNHR